MTYKKFTKILDKVLKKTNVVNNNKDIFLHFNSLWTRQPYLAPNFEFHNLTNYTKLINYVLCKM